MLEISTDARGVLTVCLNRPDVRNAFNEELIADLTRVALKDAARKDVRAVVLRGAGKVFCAGGDLNWMKKSVELSFKGNLKDTQNLSKMFVAWNEIPKPVIGAVQGAAVGGGVGLVAVCDAVVATEATEFGLSEVRLGIVPAIIGPYVVAKIGLSHSRRLFLSGERFLAKKAYDVGLVHEVVADEAAMNAEVERILGQILMCAPGALGVAKKLVLDLGVPERRKKLKDPVAYAANLLAKLRVGSEGQEGVRAFLEKRKPKWLA